jgi:hypothetical protein
MKHTRATENKDHRMSSTSIILEPTNLTSPSRPSSPPSHVFLAKNKACSRKKILAENETKQNLEGQKGLTIRKQNPTKKI